VRAIEGFVAHENPRGHVLSTGSAELIIALVLAALSTGELHKMQTTDGFFFAQRLHDSGEERPRRVTCNAL